MNPIRPIYKKLLIIAIVLYIAGTCVTLSNLIKKVGAMEHKLLHLPEYQEHVKQ